MKLYQLKKAIVIIILLFMLSPFFQSCKKIIQVEPPISQIVGQEVYNSDITAVSVLNGIYTNMFISMSGRNSGSLGLVTGVAGDELVSIADPTDILNILYTNSITNEGNRLPWTTLYHIIFKANSAIEGISASKKLSKNISNQLLGEAKLVRSLMYFYLINLYGDVPLLTTTDIVNNAKAPRAAENEVYTQIINDLKEAQSLLNDQYLGGDGKTVVSERLRPNSACATALLARIYLFTKQWSNAEKESTNLIEHSSTYNLEPLQTVFLAQSKEVIWQLQPQNVGVNTLDAELYVLLTGIAYPVPGPNGGSRPVYLSKSLFNSFEAGDLRKENWIDSVSVGGVVYPFPYKYKAWESNQPRTENFVVFRLGEQYLIRAEARAHLNDLNGAKQDLLAIRSRAGLQDILQNNQQDILSAIEKERRAELFCEWGHRWFDLKRTGTIDSVMNFEVLQKTATAKWEPFKALFPIPIDDILRNPSLKGRQNPGYPEN